MNRVLDDRHHHADCQERRQAQADGGGDLARPCDVDLDVVAVVVEHLITSGSWKAYDPLEAMISGIQTEMALKQGG